MAGTKYVKKDPLEEHGTPVFIAYDSPAFGTRTRTTNSGWSYQVSRQPTQEFKDWMAKTAGPMGALWITRKDPKGEGLIVYFAVKSQAMLAKMTWGGR